MSQCFKGLNIKVKNTIQIVFIIHLNVIINNVVAKLTSIFLKTIINNMKPENIIKISE